MRVLLVLAALGWIISLPWATLFGYLALLFIAIAMLWSISVSIERRNISPRPKSRIIDSNYVTALEAMVAEAETQVEALRAEMDDFGRLWLLRSRTQERLFMAGSVYMRTRRIGSLRRPGAPTAWRSILTGIRFTIRRQRSTGLRRRTQYSSGSLD